MGQQDVWLSFVLFQLHFWENWVGGQDWEGDGGRRPAEGRRRWGRPSSSHRTRRLLQEATKGVV